MSRSETGFEIAADGGEERCGRYSMRLHALVHEADQILRHRALIQGREAGLLELVGKLLQLRQAVVPSGETSTDVIMARLPKAVETMSLMTSPS